MVLFSQPTWGQELIPGSYRIKYGGLYKIAAEESSRWLENQWADQELLLYENGAFDFNVFLRRNTIINSYLIDWADGPPWYTRMWWDSFEEKNGGAPLNKSIVVRWGSDFKIVDTPIFSISNSFAFNWKTLEASVDFKAANPITFGIGNVPAPRYGWKFKFSPEFKFSPAELVSRPSKAIRRVGAKLIMTHWIRKPIVAIEIVTWYTPIKSRTFVGVNLVLLQW